jgi:hypothetical protein
VVVGVGDADQVVFGVVVVLSDVRGRVGDGDEVVGVVVGVGGGFAVLVSGGSAASAIIVGEAGGGAVGIGDGGLPPFATNAKGGAASVVSIPKGGPAPGKLNDYLPFSFGGNEKFIA